MSNLQKFKTPSILNLLANPWEQEERGESIGAGVESMRAGGRIHGSRRGFEEGANP
jgi:hypothetical protein